MNPSEVLEISDRITNEVARLVIGKDAALKKVLGAIIAGGHVLIEDVPGLAKTLIARSFARVMDLRFSRIQFTPDLLPGDITGSSMFDQELRRFEFLPGPVFANLILADEINRASPRTQSALLEAMQEQHVTVDGATRTIESPFIVLATQNPIDFEGTYPLPEAQLDRFMVRLSIGYPSVDAEIDIVLSRRDRRGDELDLRRIVSGAEVTGLQQAAEEIYLDRSIAAYIVAIVGETRTDNRVEIGASPRGTLALFKMSRANAMISGRDFVTPDDVQEVAAEVLSHRLVLKPEYWARHTDPADIVATAVASCPVPGPVDRGAEEAAANAKRP